MNTSSVASHVVIRLPSRVDSFISPFFEQDLKQKLQPGVTIIIDMAKTKFLEPAAASVFWAGIIQSRKEGAKIIARDMNEQVKLVLERSGLLHHLQEL
ncbi:anti-sigma factor antagonist [Leptolyngbyaceae cyanobacterium CCMR0082]|uniref:Anti-sigma factor antagonist n=2 Tax=Adonisia turfae TaxID=2950184 RepID=A0A6M0SEY1_9CYAN|nr:STAS domain-containing protein [Adonisia turfae]MDV3352460.1 STAS domain-containing protein [Leptothoe sp. LEGE 181152]NEZ58507.1 anti-sigma factor antagonist [Adonisia turfae CCMR0081]NEZ66876.1 anti-sigma factor antagonist [Adonisia turfae CCMR0082]